MKKAVKVLIVYLLSLLVCSLIFSWLGFNKILLPSFDNKFDDIGLMIIPTIIGGIISLRLIVTAKSFKIFLFVYVSLWLIRFAALYIGNQLVEVYVFNRAYRFDLIIYNYYTTVSRLQTPLPFIIYWFINYLYTIQLQPKEKLPT